MIARSGECDVAVLEAQLVFNSLALPDTLTGGAGDHHFGGAVPAVVVRTHGKAIGAGRMDGQQRTGSNRQLSGFTEEIAGFADRPNHLIQPGLTVVGLYSGNMLPRLIQGGSDQVVHTGVGNGKVLTFVFFDIDNSSQQYTGIRREVATRLKYQCLRPVAHTLENGSGVFSNINRRFVGITNAKTAAEIYVFKLNAKQRQFINQRQHSGHGVHKGCKLSNL